ncbi:TolB-like translocation protein [Tautonia rosea]|uniref:PD40 domain-containing protein n=1 Tax=Tautonia rosea TaxID=2728037 RepID=UPI0014747964|nr:PD40 domain-containing protein [Tautonia rosea]
MIASWLTSLVMVGVVVMERSDPPLVWSPSGDWIAFAVATPSVEHSLARFPFFPTDKGDQVELGKTSSDDLSSGLTFRIWAVRVSDGQALKVAESAYPLTSPAWGPDGQGLAFAQVVEDEQDRTLRWEVIIAYGEDREVITSRPLQSEPDRGETLLAEAVVWEPRGAILVVPDPDRIAVELIDHRNRATLRRIEDARFVSFSPLGNRMSFFRSRGDQWELVESDLDLGPEVDRPIDLVARIDQPAIWTSDGQSLLYLKLGNPSAEGRQTRLFKYRVSEQITQEVKEVESPALPGEQILGSYLCVGTDGLDQFFVVQFSGRSTAIAYHQGSHPLDRIHPFSGLGMIGAPSVSPDGDQLALRFGGPGVRSLPARLTLREKTLRPLIPDDELRAAWIVALGEAAEPASATVQRPTRLPLGAELGDLGPSPATYKRLADVGTRLTRDLETNPVSRSLRVRPIAFFSYLQGDYEKVDRVMLELTRTAMNADQALRILGFQAQLCLARGKDREASEMIDFIRHQRRHQVARVEEDGNGGYTVTQGVSDTRSWPDELWNVSQNRVEPRSANRLEPPASPPQTAPSPFDAVVTPEGSPRSSIQNRPPRQDP